MWPCYELATCTGCPPPLSQNWVTGTNSPATRKGGKKKVKQTGWVNGERKISEKDTPKIPQDNFQKRLTQEVENISQPHTPLSKGKQ